MNQKLVCVLLIIFSLLMMIGTKKGFWTLPFFGGLAWFVYIRITQDKS